jgi:ketol-acid reductoisomerase
MTTGRTYFASDCDRSILNDKQIAVVGYGSQGRAFAINLHDSGCSVTAVLRDGSGSRGVAQADKLSVVAPAESGNFDIIIMAIPDHEQIGFYNKYLQADAGRQRAVVLLHGLNFHFGNIEFSDNDDVILLAPHGPGTDVRRLYLDGSGLGCFFAVGQDVSGKATQIGLALADAVGFSRAGIYETTFAAETIGDLFGEQALLVGGLAGLTDAVIETMLQNGLPPENVRLETIRQLKLLAAMIEEYGPAGMLERVSKTAALGSLQAMPKLFDEAFKNRLTQLYKIIESGEFNRNLLADAAAGFEHSAKLLGEFQQRPSQKISEEN